MAQYLQIEANDDGEGAGKFIKERFDESPMLDVDEGLRHGCSMMAVACLTIEALQAFRLGLSTTRNKSRNMFAAFFAQHPAFSDFADGDWFYDDVRCGLPHDAEARGGWRILRKGPLVDKNDRVINAARFLRALRGAVSDYATQLQEDKCWALFQKKMKQVIKNCER